MKNEERPYMRWKRSSSGIRSCQSMRSWVKSMSWVAHCWRSQRLYSCSYVSRFTSPRSADSSTAGSLVAWKSSRSVRWLTVSLTAVLSPLADAPPGARLADAWLASQSGTGLRRRHDAHPVPGPRGPPYDRLAGPQAVDGRGDRGEAAAHPDRLAVERQTVLPPVLRAQLDADPDVGRHAHPARRDAPVLAGQERQRPGRLLVAGAARLVLGRRGGLGGLGRLLVAGAARLVLGRGLRLGLGLLGGRFRLLGRGGRRLGRWRRLGPGRGLLVLPAPTGGGEPETPPPN